MVEDCNAAHQYGIDTDDFNTVIDALPEDAPNTKHTRRLRARTRRLAAKRHALSRHAFHRNMVRLVRKTHLRARRIARSHHKTRRRLMAFVEGSEHNYDPSMMHTIDTAAPAFELGPHGEHAMNIAHELGNEELDGQGLCSSRRRGHWNSRVLRRRVVCSSWRQLCCASSVCSHTGCRRLRWKKMRTDTYLQRNEG